MVVKWVTSNLLRPLYFRPRVFPKPSALIALCVEPLGNPLDTGRLRLGHPPLLAFWAEPLGSPLGPSAARG